jgi:uncharacterized membrane protein
MTSRTKLLSSLITSQLDRLAFLLIFFFFIGVSVSMAVWLTCNGDAAYLAVSNRLPLSEQRYLLWTMLLSGVGAAALLIGYILFRPEPTSLEKIGQAAKAISPLLLIFALPIFFDWRVFKDEQLLLVVGVVPWSFGLEYALRTALKTAPLNQLSSRLWSYGTGSSSLRGFGPLMLIAGFFLFYAAYFGYHSIVQHYNLKTQSYDLAIFDNQLWNLARGEWFISTPAMGPTGSHIGRHATFLAPFFVPFYLLRQKPDTLLLLQTMVVGASTIPLFFIAKHHLQNVWIAVAFSLVFVFYAPLHGPLFYDFHYLTLAPVFVLLVFYCFETEKKWALAIAVCLALLLREDIGFGLAAAFLFLMLSGKRPRTAFTGMVLCLLYAVLVKFVVMPFHQSDGAPAAYSGIYQGLVPSGEGGFGAVLLSIVTNPLHTLKVILTEEKFIYVMKICGPLLLLPLRNSRTWILLVFAAMVTLLSTGQPTMFQTSFQYSAYWAPYVFAGSIYALAWWRDRADGRSNMLASTIAILVVSLVFSYHDGAILQHNTFRGGFRKVGFETTSEDTQNRRDLYALIGAIPATASVAATENEAPHVSNRRSCFTMRHGHHQADYLLLKTAEAGFGVSRQATELALASGKYGLVDLRGNYMLWARGHSQRQNQKGYRFLGMQAK